LNFSKENYLINRKGCSCYCCQHWVMFPVIISLLTPVESKRKHENQYEGPKNFSYHCLIGKEDVNEALDCRVFGVVKKKLIDAAAQISFYFFIFIAEFCFSCPRYWKKISFFNFLPSRYFSIPAARAVYKLTKD